ncbi:quinone oxidoreductase family protein [Telmatospirillum siberiense]|uniref:Quinone oxidoreductase n=1 Tax=Telmatospirillum siberiense TaxID=382514 RepID=A0A2N3PN08_9PROT|nr:quinone oxidoreductase [Telmatospirillum siberiense]PKU21770.1 quinone oxidoreductase [Telmatospirillum siberiense]
MSKAILIHRQGGPEEMRWEEVEVLAPGPGEALIRHTAVGLNFIDVYHRSGVYPLAKLPSSLGSEGAGVVEAIGSGVQEVKVGDRVAYAGGPIGAYAERRVLPAARLVVLPPSIEDRQAAAMMLQGMTTQYLLRSTYRVQPGDTILLHAAAGGVGLIACQWAKHLGATVIGTVGSSAKAELAKAHGADYVIDYSKENFVARVKEITGGKGVPVVYDSVGKDTFEGSLDCLRPRGLMVSFGQSSGLVPPFNPVVLSTKGSLFLTRPTLATYTASRGDLLASAGELFDVVGKGAVKIEINQSYPLAEAAQAHRDLEARKTTGSTVFLV